jgi:hypothetical protein
MPESVVVCVCETPVASFVIVTLAPAIDACFASTTRPVTRDVLVCAAAVSEQTAIKTTASSDGRVGRMERPPLVVNKDGKKPRVQPLAKRRWKERFEIAASAETQDSIRDGGSISRHDLASRFWHVFCLV